MVSSLVLKREALREEEERRCELELLKEASKQATKPGRVDYINEQGKDGF
jgi:hypothetical protein